MGACVPDWRNAAAGAIQDVNPDITEYEVSAKVSSPSRISLFRRFSTSSCVKQVLKGDGLSASVKVGPVRYFVRPHVPRPL